MEDKYITLTWSFVRDKRTTMQEKLVLMEIVNLSMLKFGCIAQNEHFSELMGVHKEAISRLINSLVKKGFINVAIKNGSRNFSRVITLNKLLFDPKQIVITPLTNCLESKGNIQSKKQDIVFSDFKDKFDFINEESFSMLVSHLKAKYGNVTKARIINNIKKLKDNPSLFIKAVEKMIELDYSGLFVPSSQDKKIKVQENSYVPKYQIHNGKKRADF